MEKLLALFFKVRSCRQLDLFLSCLQSKKDLMTSESVPVRSSPERSAPPETPAGEFWLKDKTSSGDQGKHNSKHLKKYYNNLDNLHVDPL